MFIVLLTYTQPLDQVDLLMQAHVDFLDAQYASGRFLASGRRVPRTGGVILATGDSRDQIEQIVRSDPFHREGVARYEIIEFAPSMTAPHLAALKNL